MINGVEHRSHVEAHNDGYRAIVRDLRVFLFDEPLSNLDAALRVRRFSAQRWGSGQSIWMWWTVARSGPEKWSMPKIWGRTTICSSMPKPMSRCSFAAPASGRSRWAPGSGCARWTGSCITSMPTAHPSADKTEEAGYGFFTTQLGSRAIFA